jgi:hypothetical protein
MQQIRVPSEAGFVVDWQIAEDGPVIELPNEIDLSTGGSEVHLGEPSVRPDPAADPGSNR